MDVVNENGGFPDLREFSRMILTFFLTVFAWIFFRSENIFHALDYISGLFSISLFTLPNFSLFPGSITLIILILAFLWVEWKGRRLEFGIEGLKEIPKKWQRWSFYFLLIFIIDIFGNTSEEIEFIYFQF
ncbi:MBOAT family O-acyltransferase [Algoriphagus pacificus]|uniref:hypothetical protein n=1 Tax=Algoriphagus pacificus TaxID=2811234 RepID=UPI00293D2B94|nr:hypothetical protein [Algoriphagus pacificus]